MTAPAIPAPVISRYGASWQLDTHHWVSVRPAWGGGWVVTETTPGGPLVTHAGHPRGLPWGEAWRIGRAQGRPHPQQPLAGGGMTDHDLAERLAAQGDTPEPLFEVSSGPRIGSLFSGYGGLDMAARAALGGSVAWHCEIEPAACRVLARHWAGVPNHGDVTAVDWSSVERVDVLTGGFPCQDVSSAGRRAGLRPGTRSGLWAHMAYAIDQLRPGLVVIENVRGLLSADAACDVEPCPWCLGDDEGRPLRALGAVLGDLADLGYDARWCGLRAADVGAPHGRYRIFIVAEPARHADGVNCDRRAAAGFEGQAGPAIGSAADADGFGSVRARGARGRRRGAGSSCRRGSSSG